MKKIFVVMVISLLVAVGSFAADSGKSMEVNSGFSKEQREKMAVAHEKMANCLRSEKVFAECREEMMQSCQKDMGGESCPMWEKMRGKRGMMKNGMRGQNTN